MLREELVKDEIKRSASDAKEIAAEGLKVGNNGAAFLPLLFLFEVDDAIRDGEVFSEAPFVASAEAGGYGVIQVVVDVG